MPIQKKYFNEEIFLQQINSEKLTGQQLSVALESEISRVEQLKIMLIEDIQKNPEPTVRITNDIDSYIYNIQAILEELGADRYTREVLSTDQMVSIRNKILEIIEKGHL